MSLIEILRKKVKVDLFTTPSHSQKFFIFNKLRQFYKYDISEVDAYNPQEALKKAQEKAAKIYKTKSTFFLTNGSTSGITAAVLSCVQKGDKVLIWDDAHPAHLNAVKLAGAEPIFYNVEKDENWGIYKSVDSNEILEKFETNLPSPLEGEGISQLEERKLEKLGEGLIKAVIVTSPTYEGIVSDIAKLKDICEKHGAYLIVDEAHGALYPFCDELSPSAIYQGADFIIQSLHKTAGGLNPTALLHCNLPRHCETKGGSSKHDCPPKQSHCTLDVQSALEMVTTTSPSYPLLASIEKNINFLNSKRGKKMICQLIININNMRKKLNNIEFYDGDVTKIVVKAPNLSGLELSEYLYKKGIEDERTNEKSTMLLCGIGTDLKKIKKLEKALSQL